MVWNATLKEFEPGNLVAFAIAADIPITSNALAPLSALSANVVSGQAYNFSIQLFVNDSAGGGIQIALDGGTATVSNLRASYFAFDNAPGVIMKHVTALNTIASADQLSGAAIIQIEGYFVATSTGTFIPRIAQVTATGTLTIYRGGSNLVQEAPA